MLFRLSGRTIAGSVVLPRQWISVPVVTAFLCLLLRNCVVVGFWPHAHHRHHHHHRISATRLYDVAPLWNFLNQEDVALLAVDDASYGNYVPAATTLFVNMLTPASILAAGMISIGVKAAPFKPPTAIQDDPDMVQQIDLLKRLYIIVTLISFCSELLAVMWATVAINQLTERNLEPATSVWELLVRDCDLEWAAVNSHFVLGMVGFMILVGIRGYIMLLEAEASEAVMVSTLSGVGAALLLMVSIVNRGVQAGGGNGLGYGATVLDMFGHYVTLLYQRAQGMEAGIFDGSFGPLGMGAIFLEVISIAFAAYAILFQSANMNLGKLNQKLNQTSEPENQNSDLMHDNANILNDDKEAADGLATGIGNNELNR
ncbi:expressed unknown protein [Seminavis robusta]|uniref:Uncharacterized protein n=1 Tax=Seminavis robusta TaxID=568900 RepID=A0A9N8E2X4_9STRA|nr:expressed unknown protein [Seminavis robusta]|eukprot:Sro595_g172610.1 n/a (372) ;mRNA; f:18644-19759